MPSAEDNQEKALGDYERWAVVVLLAYHETLRSELAHCNYLQAHGTHYQKSLGVVTAERLRVPHLTPDVGKDLVDWHEVTRALAEAGLPRRPALLPLGRHHVAEEVLERHTSLEVCIAALRHSRGEWGELDAEKLERNKRNLRDGGPLISVHHCGGGRFFYIITETYPPLTIVIRPEQLDDNY